MRSNSVPITMPLGGLFESEAYGAQPEGTSVDALNSRGIDPITGRATLCQRAGVSKFNSNQLSGANAVKDLVAVVKHDSRLTYTVDTTPEVGWSKEAPIARYGIALAIDRQSNVYVAGSDGAGGTGINNLCKYNSAGALVWSVPIALEANAQIVKSIRVNEYGDLFVLIGGAATNCYLLRFIQVPGDEAIRPVWRFNLPNGKAGIDVAIKGGFAYVLELESGATTAYLHKLDNILTVSPQLTWSANIVAAAATRTVCCCAISIDGGCVVAFSDTANPPAVTGYLRKYGPMAPTGGPPVAAVWEYGVAANKDGIGQACVIDASGYIYSQGYNSGAAGDCTVRKLKDNGGSAPTETSTWKTTATVFKGPQSLDVDAQGYVYQTIEPAAGNNRFARLNTAGTTVDYTLTTSTLSAAWYAVVVDPNQTDNDTKTEFVYVGTAPLATTNYAVHRLNLLDVAQAAGSPRELVYLGACNGNIIKFPRGAGAVSTPSGGSGALDSGARFQSAVAIFNRAFFADGINYRTYDAMTDTVSEWTATSAGELPRRCRLLAAWNGRPVLSGAENDPHNWFMGRSGDWFDWDYFPAEQDPTQAVAGNIAKAGLCPDIVNCLIPYSDDLLIFGGDHTIHRLTGDPMAGGVFDLISDVTGIAFGSPWCKDETGAVYFFGSRGGVFRLVPGSLPVRISAPIDGRFQSLDVSAYKVRMAWNDAEEGLHLWLTPYAGGTATHFYWDRTKQAWWKDQYASTSIDPYSVLVADGDAADDRQILIGGSDGYVRAVDLDATSDDGSAISSYVFVGPIQAGQDVAEFKMNDLRAVLANGSGSVDYAVYAAESPDFNVIGSAVHSGTWSAGRNDAVHDRARGQSVWIKVGRYVSPSSGRWGIERLSAGIMPAGMVRNR